VYASYVVKFVCYYLRIISDEEARIAQVRQLQNKIADDGSNRESSSKADSDEDEFDSNNTEEDNST
jgi:hypothetical protein